MPHPVDIMIYSCIVAGASCCVLAMYSAAELVKLRSDGVSATAEIVGFNQVHASQRRSRSGTVRHGARRDRLKFEAEGETVLFSADVGASAEMLGEVEVLYLRDDPETACVAPCNTTEGIYIAGGFGLLLLGAGLWMRQRVADDVGDPDNFEDEWQARA